MVPRVEPRLIPRRAARPPSPGAAGLADPVLRRAHRAGFGVRPAGHRRRRPHLSGFLRRHSHHHDRSRRARGGRRHPHPGRPHAAHLDPVPGPAHDRAGRAHLGAVGHPRRQGVLRQLRERGQRHRPAAVLHGPAVQPGAGPAQQLPRAVVCQHGHAPGCGPGRRRASRRSTSATCTAGTATAARSAICPTTSTSPPASPTSRT